MVEKELEVHIEPRHGGEWDCWDCRFSLDLIDVEVEEPEMLENLMQSFEINYIFIIYRAHSFWP